MRSSSTSAGYVCGIAAFSLWAAFPIYLKLLAHAAPEEILAHRVIWTIPVCIAILLARRRLCDLSALWQWPGRLPLLGCSALLMAMQWSAYLWATAEGRILEASLGYFLSPLIGVLLGTLFFGERLRRLQWVAVALAGMAVALALTMLGRMPYFGIAMAVTFSAYGAVRKLAQVEAVSGLLAEVTILLPLAGSYLLWLMQRDEAVFTVVNWQTDLLLIAAGIVTAVPLILFGIAARHLNVSATGMLIYITPIGLFLLAVLIYGEPVEQADMVVFGLIWAALVLFILEHPLRTACRHLDRPRNLPHVNREILP